MTKKVNFICVLVFLVFSQKSYAEKVQIAVLESFKDTQNIRLIFEFTNIDWKKVNNVSQASTYNWNVSLNSKKIGEATSKPLKSNLPSELGLQALIKPISPTLMITANNDKYENWRGSPKYRPLVAISSDQISSSKINKVSLSKKSKNNFISEFIAKIPDTESCDKDSGRFLNKREKYSEKDILILESFNLENGATLIGARINPKINKCDGPIAKEWESQWFLISQDSSISFLESSIYPVDYINIKNVGLVWVFTKSRYNEDGYVLFYDNFKKSITTSWKYH